MDIYDVSEENKSLKAQFQAADSELKMLKLEKLKLLMTNSQI